MIESGDVLIAIGHAESLMKLAALAKGEEVQCPKSNVQSLKSNVSKACLESC